MKSHSHVMVRSRVPWFPFKALHTSYEELPAHFLKNVHMSYSEIDRELHGVSEPISARHCMFFKNVSIHVVCENTISCLSESACISDL